MQINLPRKNRIFFQKLTVFQALVITPIKILIFLIRAYFVIYYRIITSSIGIILSIVYVAFPSLSSSMSI